MFDKRVINSVAVAMVALFVVQSGADILSASYEVPAGMYGIISVIVTALVGAAVGVNLGDRRKRNSPLDEFLKRPINEIFRERDEDADV